MQRMARLVFEKGKNERWTILAFVLVFSYVFWFMFSTGSMVEGSGDATDIWKTITTFGSGETHGSYVLYKGMFALYPYMILYRLAVFFGTNEFLFIMLLRAFLFAYLCIIGLPFTISRITGKTAFLWQKLLFACAIFFFWRKTMIIDQLMVDFPRIVILVMAANSVLRLKQEDKIPKWVKYSVSGLLVGACFCLAGTTALAGVCLLMYAMVATLPLKVLREKAGRGIALVLALVFLSCSMILPQLDKQFEKNVATPFREQGYWVPTKQDILTLTLTQFMDKYAYFPTIASPRGFAIMANEQGLETALKASEANGGWLTTKQYISIVLKYPVDFVTIWANRLFLMISMNYTQHSTVALVLAYSLLYLAIVTAVKKCKKWKNVLNINFWICLAFLMAVAGSVVSIVEMRMGAPLQAFVIAVAILSDTFWQGCKSFYVTIKQFWAEKRGFGLSEKAFPWSLALWPVFVLACFSHISMLYELIAVETSKDMGVLNSILFR